MKTNYPNSAQIRNKRFKTYVLESMVYIDPSFTEEEFLEYEDLYEQTYHDDDNIWCRACIFSQWKTKFSKFEHDLLSRDKNFLAEHFNQNWGTSDEKSKEIVENLSSKLNLIFE